jgi:hypothetical protein
VEVVLIALVVAHNVDREIGGPDKVFRAINKSSKGSANWTTGILESKEDGAIQRKWVNKLSHLTKGARRVAKLDANKV